MPRKADGEFEVLLGDKQLLSIFVVVVILLVAFFTMGYVLGKSTATGSAAARTPVAKTPSSGLPDSPAPGQTIAPITPPRTSVSAKLPAPVPEPLPDGQTSGSVIPPAPAPGELYLQLFAVKRPEAELLADVLKRKGFPARLAPGPTEGVFRVLVGPFEDADRMAKTRAALEAAKFKSIVRRY